ncbi:MAG TPA: hypothetical protein VGO55_13125 [Allosphingosinicella sp.]|jgi:hypothetical protein|nr:hypothetical protein [Allosphingosinicella sp.]
MLDILDTMFCMPYIASRIINIERVPVAFREKIAWLTLVTMAVAYGVYFGIVGPAAGFGERRMLDIIWSFGLIATGHAVAMVVGAIIIAVTATKEAQARADELSYRRGWHG